MHVFGTHTGIYLEKKRNMEDGDDDDFVVPSPSYSSSLYVFVLTVSIQERLCSFPSSHSFFRIRFKHLFEASPGTLAELSCPLYGLSSTLFMS